jgi:hypothetical protein
MISFLLIYALIVVWMFRVQVNGQRRRWQSLDYIWVPLGGVTGIILLAMWWRAHAAL